MKVENFELIKSMDLGQTWQECSPSDAPLPGQYIREFHNTMDAEAIVRLYYRGAPLAKQAADQFAQILSQPRHALTGKEKDAVTLVIRSASDPNSFQIELLETQSFNGRNALQIQGTWTIAESKFFALYVPEDLGVHGHTIHEFQYFAPPDKFERYRPEALQAFQSVQWR